MSSHPQEVAEMDAKIISLENKVSQLKVLEPEVERLQNLLKARDQEIAEGQRQREALRNQASEADALMCDALVQLADEGPPQGQLGSGAQFLPGLGLQC